jgi:hypothetical protein
MDQQQKSGCGQGGGGSTIELLFDGLAQVLDEMKSIGALAGLRRALVGAASIEAASVSGHDLGSPDDPATSEPRIEPIGLEGHRRPHAVRGRQ